MRALELGILSVAFTAIASSKRGLNLNSLTVENASVKIYKLGEEIAKLTIKLNIFIAKQKDFSIKIYQFKDKKWANKSWNGSTI